VNDLVPAGVQGWDRYAYVNNNPGRYTDPTGHEVCIEESTPGNCIHNYSDYYEQEIKKNYGVTLSDDGGKDWDLRNMILVLESLGNIDDALEGELKSRIGGARFQLGEYVATPDNCHLENLGCSYSGYTVGTNITFYTQGDAAIRQMNIYHEFGHLIDSLPGKDNQYSNQLGALDHPGFIVDNHINSAALISGNPYDPNYGIRTQAKQASSGAVTEQWADVFANYVAGNIDLSHPNGPGSEMDDFVRGVLGLKYPKYP